MKKGGMWILAVIILVVVILSINPLILMSTTNQATSPSWNFVYGYEREKYHSGGYSIGDFTFNAGSPIFLKDKKECQTEKRIVDFPNPSENCWEIEFSFSEKSYKVKPYQIVKLNDYLQVSWNPTEAVVINGEVCHTIDGEKVCRNLKYEYDFEEPQWKSQFTFSFYDMSFLDFDITNQRVIDMIENKSYIYYSIYNDFTRIDGGSVIREEFKLWKPSNKEKVDSFKIEKGRRDYESEISSDTLGDKTVFVTPFITVNNLVMGISNKMNIYSESKSQDLRTLPNLGFSKDNTIEPETTKEVSFLWVYILLGFVGLIVIVLLLRKK